MYLKKTKRQLNKPTTQKYKGKYQKKQVKDLNVAISQNEGKRLPP